MGTGGHDTAIIHGDDGIGKSNGRETMRHDEQRSRSCQGLYGLDNFHGGFDIDLADGVIKSQNSPFRQQGAGKCDTLFLSAGQYNTLFPHNRIQPVREG